jgi:hypothetical protein
MRKAVLGACLSLLLLLAAPAKGQPDEPFRPKGFYNNSVHRFHPDLEARLNVVRYARWRMLEIAWDSGVADPLDREISSYVSGLLLHAPRFAPEADRVAPLLARDAPAVFRALRWGQTLEQQLLDVLASSDAGPRVSATRLERALLLYRRERYALSETASPAPADSDGPVSTRDAARRLLVSGTKLFVLAAADLATPGFGEQRWRIRQTVADFNRSWESESPGDATYLVSAPAVSAAFPGVTRALDRLEEFRLDVLDALAPGGAKPEARRRRAEGLHAVARRYGLSAEGIGAH